jgi:sigma-E factor negative regulatory protein RseB
MQRLIVLYLILFSVSCPTYAANNSAEAMQWLERMAAGFRELNYRGTFAYEQGDDMESLRISHAVFEGQEFERLQYLDGAKREIVRRGEQLSCFQPGQKLIRFYQQQQNLKQGSQRQQLQNYYDVAMAGAGRVAGRNVVEIKIIPRDQHRLGYQLALDKQSGLLLRMKLIGNEQTVLERFQFVEIEVGAELSQDVFQLQDSTGNSGMAVVAANPVNYFWKIKWLPDGFGESSISAKAESHDMRTYSDGLAAFSVFVEPDDTTIHQAAQQLQRGATVAYSNLVEVSGKPHRVTVVGEIPAQTARYIAESVELLQ